jgi:hypothetical protein
MRRAAAELSSSPRNVARSTRHSDPPLTAFTVAARGELYRHASSPVYVFPCAVSMSTRPVSRRRESAYDCRFPQRKAGTLNSKPNWRRCD